VPLQVVNYELTGQEESGCCERQWLPHLGCNHSKHLPASSRFPFLAGDFNLAFYTLT